MPSPTKFTATRTIRGLQVPSFLYGTAWKEERTLELTRAALAAGFRGIDTANQRKHYHEAGVGEAVAEALASGIMKREELFLQTKYTFASGQDHRLPYDKKAPITAQVEQSFARSLEHLRTSYVDSYVLHGPMMRRGLTAGDWEAWRAMEALQKAAKTRLLGVSNVSLEQLTALLDGAAIKPAFVQNRCFARMRWDHAVRALCAQHDVVYQGFSLLTANAAELRTAAVQELAASKKRSPAELVFRFAIQAGMLPLTGTSSSAHMQQDLSCFDFELSKDDMRMLENIAS